MGRGVRPSGCEPGREVSAGVRETQPAPAPGIYHALREPRRRPARTLQTRQRAGSFFAATPGPGRRSRSGRALTARRRWT